ncbi:hypothetical protein [Sulfurospirillum arcachonense]|uniref:hypothetical protein n=1 Tax=Sulfurospirillum arcachonense TaxID=57666 RepID=UPI00046AEB28|nr:hypothetical protein [Sulfurospirillum arcachonense]
METLSLKTKKQIVLSRIIYDYIINGIADSISTISEQDQQLLIMRINMQAITHAIDISQEEEITDFNYSFNQLGLSFDALVPLSEIEFSNAFIDTHIDLMRTELGEDFVNMVKYLKKMENTVV